MDSITLYKWPGEIDLILDDFMNDWGSCNFILNGSNVAFRLALEQRTRQNYGQSALYLELRDLAGESSVNVKFRLWIEDSFGKKFLTTPVEMMHEFTEVGERFGSKTFAPFDSIFKSTTVFAKHNFAIFCCQVMRIKPEKDHDLKFRNKYYEFYQQGIFDDYVLHVGREEYIVPKNFLMASSELFENMFADGTRESNTVEMVGVCSEIVVNFIKYLHTGKMDDLDELSEETFVFADRYAIETLKDLCVKAMSETFNKDNIIRRFQLASEYESVDLRNHAVFYMTNYGSEGNLRYILQTDEWQELVKEDSKLANEISNTFFDKMA